MKIVIVGGGKVGEKLCAELTKERNDVWLIEKNPARLEQLINKFDITGVVGNGAMIEIQQEVGVETADVFIAVTQADELNLIACVLAKNLGASDTIARVRHPEYSNQHHVLKQSLGISMIINPEYSAAHDIANILKYPAALSAETFAGDRVSFVEYEIDATASVCEMDLRTFRQKYKSVLVCMSIRSEEVIIPDGDYRIQAGDRLFVTGETRDLVAFSRSLGKNKKRIRSHLMVGGGILAYYVLKLLEVSHIRTTLIEINPEKVETLSYQFPQTSVILGDGSDYEVLDEQGVANFDAFTALTGMDEENLVMSVYARQKGVHKVITKMNRLEILKIMQPTPIKTLITPKQIAANEIVQFVRARMNTQGSNVEALYRLVEDRVEVLEFKVSRNSRMCNVPLMDLKTKPNVLVAYILRNGRLIFPNGQDQLQADDRVLVVTHDAQFDDLDDILE